MSGAITDYGLCFYRRQPLRHYLQENSATEKQSVITGIPNEEHILVLRSDDHTALDRFVPDRTHQQLLVDEWQGIAVYRIGPAGAPLAALRTNVVPSAESMR